MDFRQGSPTLNFARAHPHLLPSAYRCVTQRNHVRQTQGSEWIGPPASRRLDHHRAVALGPAPSIAVSISSHRLSEGHNTSHTLAALAASFTIMPRRKHLPIAIDQVEDPSVPRLAPMPGAVRSAFFLVGPAVAGPGGWETSATV